MILFLNQSLKETVKVGKQTSKVRMLRFGNGSDVLHIVTYKSLLEQALRGCRIEVGTGGGGELRIMGEARAHPKVYSKSTPMIHFLDAVSASNLLGETALPACHVSIKMPFGSGLSNLGYYQ